jgi:hypothetical protein
MLGRPGWLHSGIDASSGSPIAKGLNVASFYGSLVGWRQCFAGGAVNVVAGR